MKHFVSVIFENQLNENKRDIVIDTMINTAKVGLVESGVEYDLFESENSSTVLRLPLSKPIPSKLQKRFVEALANKLFDKGHNNFEIELTEATLRRGSRGDEVRALQAQLGMPANQQDGIFGPQTEQALRAFQQRAGIQVDGIAGGQTQAALAAGGAPRNAGAARPATAPFTPDGGSATRTPPAAAAPQQPTTAAPQTSPRPQPRPAQTPAPAQPTAPAAVQQTAQQRRNAQAAADTYAGGNLAGEFDTTATGALRARTAGQPAPRVSNRPDPNDPRGNQIAPARPTAAAQTATVAGRPDVPVGQLPRGAAAAAPAAAQPARTPRAQTTTGSARAAGQSGRGGMAGDETNALDAIAADRAAGRLPDVPAGAGPRGVPADGPTAIAGPGQAARPGARPAPVDPQAARGAAVAADNPAAPGTPDATADIGPVTAAPAAQTTVAGRSDVPVSSLPAAAPAAQGAGDAAVDARMDGDASAAPAARAAQALGTAMRGFGTDEEGIASALQGISSQQEWEQIKASYDGDLLADLQSELNRRDYRRYVTDVLQAAGIQEGVPARPKGAFMFRERAEWDAAYGKTHNKDGSIKPRNFITESKMQEVTFHDDDKFFEAYGVLWFNEDEMIDEAEYQGRKVKLGKPMAGDVKKFKVYVRNPQGNVVKVNFGQKGAKIKKSNPERRRSFRARHNCDNPGPRHKARYWSCRKW